MGIGPGPDTETHGMCEVCQAKVTVEAALAHALVGLKALGTDATRLADEITTIALEVERVRIGIWLDNSNPEES